MRLFKFSSESTFHIFAPLLVLDCFAMIIQKCLLFLAAFGLRNSAQSASALATGSGATALVKRADGCGCEVQVLNGTSGRIEYKTSEPLGRNERCNWAIRADRATQYTIGIFYLGFPEPNSDHQLTITGFPGRETFPLQHAVPEDMGLFELNSSSVLLVTLHTGSKANIYNRTGFYLEYTSHSHDSAFASPTAAITEFVDANKEGFTEVEMRANTGRRVDMILYNWEKFNPDQDRLKVAYVRRAWSVNNYLQVYSFSSNSGWQLSDTLRMANASAIYDATDMLLFVYRGYLGYSQSFTLANLLMDGSQCNQVDENSNFDAEKI